MQMAICVRVSIHSVIQIIKVSELHHQVITVDDMFGLFPRDDVITRTPNASARVELQLQHGPVPSGLTQGSWSQQLFPAPTSYTNTLLFTANFISQRVFFICLQ